MLSVAACVPGGQDVTFEGMDQDITTTMHAKNVNQSGHSLELCLIFCCDQG